MQPIYKPGHFYLGRIFNTSKSEGEENLFYESKNLTTHAVCVGMTGSGKTGLGIVLLEEAALSGIPALIIDPKGDLGNLMLTFPQLQRSAFLPWIDPAEAARKGQTVEQYAETMAKTWKEGLNKWGEGEERIQKLREAVDIAIYTPASEAGISLSILNSFAAPAEETRLDTGAMRDRILSTTSSLLGLLGMDVDPINSREHILISTLFEKAWSEKQDLDLPLLIQQIQTPPFEKIGVMATDSFFPEKERMNLSLRLNNLLASPGFQAWMQGEPLDIQSLLYTPQGKPRLAIVTIAHLADSERMFFVTLLLNELLGWMRRQSGTANLRALLYMDEIFGFFPPTAMPPSKMPMLTLLKQARAYGLGVVLATQNPVDLDYKGLSNCGTWFIGKLQTDRDRAKVLEGISKESDRGSLNQMMAACGSRVFMLRSVYLPEPLLFQTRWTLSYLRGPLTLPQIHALMVGKREKKAIQPSSKEKQKPTAPVGIVEVFMPVQSPSRTWTYRPKVLGVAKLHFVDSKKKIDTWSQVALVAPLSEAGSQVAWELGEDIHAPLSKQAEPSAIYEELPAALMQAKNFSAFSKAFEEHLYQNQTLDLFEATNVMLTSKLGESETDFRKRVALALTEQVETDVRAIRERFANKMKTLQDRVQRAEDKAEEQKSQVWRQKMDTVIAVVTTVIGALLGRKVSRDSVSQAGTSIRKAGRISKEQEEVTRSEESLGTLQQQLQLLQEELDKEIALRRSVASNPNQIEIEKTVIRPRKKDIDVEQVTLIWCPVDII